jgi:hypothetical protein
MSDFIYLFRGGLPADPNVSPEAAKKQMERWRDWTIALQKANKHVGGERLKSPRKTVSSNGMVTDGPFAESKEMVGGYIIVKAGDLNEATKMAHDCPIFEYGGSVEVREIQSMEM